MHKTEYRKHTIEVDFAPWCTDARYMRVSVDHEAPQDIRTPSHNPIQTAQKIAMIKIDRVLKGEKGK